MRSPKKVLTFCILFLVLLPMGMSSSSAECKPLAECLPVAERDFFILDISTSNDVSAIWVNSLRPSLISKLRNPFGVPKDSLNQKTGIAPLDVYVSAISSNSASEKLNPVFTSNDAREMWGMISDVGKDPSDKRLSKLYEEILGSSGVYTKTVGLLTNAETLIMTKDSCKTKALRVIQEKGFISLFDTSQKNTIAKTVCEIGIRIQDNLRTIDLRFKNSKCASAKCSDVMGAILNLSKAADDLAAEESGLNSRPKLCIAIASDMQHNDPTMKVGSILNSRRVAETAKSVLEAGEHGRRAANAIGLKFPSEVDVRVFVLGEGTGKNPIPLERNQFFNAYWSSFWAQSGVKINSQAKSLDRACTNTVGKDERR